MPVTRIVDSEDEEETYIDDNTASRMNGKRARFSVTEKGKGRAAVGAQAHSGNADGSGLEDEAGDDEYNDGEEDDDDDDAVEEVAGSGRTTGGKAGGGGGSASRTKLAWEEEYSRSWDALTEDAAGSLEGAVAAFLTNSKRRRVLRDTTAVQRGIIRHLYLVLDLSESMEDKDMRPSRLEVSLRYIIEFIQEFFDQNPISQLAIVGTLNGMATRISALGGNPTEHLKKVTDLLAKKKEALAGEPSLQNALNMARSGLSHLPTHGSREVVIIFGSLTTCDPGNIHDTIDALVKDRVRVNIVGLSAEMSICREICKKTRGVFNVCLNEDHFKDLLFENILPPASLKPSALSVASGETASNGSSLPKSSGQAADLMIMGFPTLLSSSSSQNPTLCACHSKLYRPSKGYLCPRCDSRLCDVPTECAVCRLTIVSSPHLARSYRHLFPVGNWRVVNGAAGGQELPSKCFGCSVRFPPVSATTGPPPTARTEAQAQPAMNGKDASNPASAAAGTISSTGRYQCPKCENMFCIDCDIFVHSLGACPGCQQ